MSAFVPPRRTRVVPVGENNRHGRADCKSSTILLQKRRKRKRKRRRRRRKRKWNGYERKKSLKVKCSGHTHPAV